MNWTVKRSLMAEKEGKEMRSEVTVRKIAQAIDSTSYHVRWGEDRWEEYSQHREQMVAPTVKYLPSMWEA